MEEIHAGAGGGRRGGRDRGWGVRGPARESPPGRALPPVPFDDDGDDDGDARRPRRHRGRAGSAPARPGGLWVIDTGIREPRRGVAVRELAGCRALVTGASGGLGHDIAVALAREGVDVAISGRNVSALDELARRLRGFGTAAERVVADLADPVEAQGLIRRAEDAIGPIGILVNNAGIEIASSFTLYSEDEVQRILV